MFTGVAYFLIWLRACSGLCAPPVLQPWHGQAVCWTALTRRRMTLLDAAGGMVGGVERVRRTNETGAGGIYTGMGDEGTEPESASVKRGGPVTRTDGGSCKRTLHVSVQLLTIPCVGGAARPKPSAAVGFGSHVGLALVVVVHASQRGAGEQQRMRSRTSSAV